MPVILTAPVGNPTVGAKVIPGVVGWPLTGFVPAVIGFLEATIRLFAAVIRSGIHSYPLVGADLDLHPTSDPESGVRLNTE